MRQFLNVIYQVTTQADKDLCLKMVTLFDSGSHWKTNMADESYWDKANNGAYWYTASPASANTLMIMEKWVDPTADYNDPRFMVFRTAKGPHCPGLTKEEFDLFRANAIVDVDSRMDDLLVAHALTGDAVVPEHMR